MVRRVSLNPKPRPRFIEPMDAGAWQPSPNGPHEVAINKIVSLAPRSPALEDDRPINEYYLVRSGVHLYR